MGLVKEAVHWKLKEAVHGGQVFLMGWVRGQITGSSGTYRMGQGTVQWGQVFQKPGWVRETVH